MHFLPVLQVVFLTACLHVFNTAYVLPPHLIATRSIGPAAQHAQLFSSVNQRLQRRRTRRQPDWEEEQEEEEEEEEGDDDNNYGDEEPIEGDEEPLPPVRVEEPAWQPSEDDAAWDPAPEDTSEEDARVSSAPTWNAPVPKEEPKGDQSAAAPEPKEPKMRVASATAEDTTMSSSSGIVEDTSPVVAALFRPEMRQGIDYSHVPAIAPKPVGSGLCPGSQCAPGDCERCWETCGSCPRPETAYGCKDKTQWSLTFDDGPSPYTAKLLDTLKEKNVYATFFVMGGQVAKYPDVIRRMYQEGHEVASHTWSHPHLMSLTDDQIIAEIKQTEDLIFSLIGQRPRYFRPPYGETDERVRSIMEAHGLKAILWNMDTLDYSIVNNNQDPKQIVQAFDKVAASGTTELNPFNNPGFVSLQHDIYLKSVEQERDIIDLLAGRGLKMVTVSQCTGDGQPYKNAPQGSTSVQPVGSQPLPASPVQPNNSQPLPASPAVPNGAASVLPAGSSSAPADGTLSASSEPHAQQLKDSANQPAGGFIVAANEPKDSAAATLATGMLLPLTLLSTLVSS